MKEEQDERQDLHFREMPLFFHKYDVQKAADSKSDRKAGRAGLSIPFFQSTQVASTSLYKPISKIVKIELPE